jgi:branched-chain amino acid transport system substrate-binding protein
MARMHAFAFALLLLLSACVQQQAGPPTPPAQDAYVIGFVGPLTGSAAALGESWRNAVELAADDVNAAGGVNGRPLKVIYEDGVCNAKDAATAFQKLLNGQDIKAVIPYCSPELLAIAPMAQERRILIVGPGATSPAITQAGEHVFRLAPSDELQGVVGARLLEKDGYSRIAVLYINNDYGAGLNKVLKENLGEKVVVSESFTTDGASDVRSQLAKVKGANVDALYIASLPQEGMLVLKQLRELGLDVPVIGSEAMKSAEVLPVGEGIRITAPAGEGAGFDDFRARYEERFGSAPEIFAAESYDAVHVIVAAASNNPDDPVAGMQQIKEYDGVAGKVAFDENGDVTKPYDIFRVENGTFVAAGEVTVDG